MSENDISEKGVRAFATSFVDAGPDVKVFTSHTYILILRTDERNSHNNNIVDFFIPTVDLFIPTVDFFIPLCCSTCVQCIDAVTPSVLGSVRQSTQQ